MCTLSWPVFARDRPMKPKALGCQIVARQFDQRRHSIMAALVWNAHRFVVECCVSIEGLACQGCPRACPEDLSALVASERMAGCRCTSASPSMSGLRRGGDGATLTNPRTRNARSKRRASFRIRRDCDQNRPVALTSRKRFRKLRRRAIRQCSHLPPRPSQRRICLVLGAGISHVRRPSSVAAIQPVATACQAMRAAFPIMGMVTPPRLPRIDRPFE